MEETKFIAEFLYNMRVDSISQEEEGFQEGKEEVEVTLELTKEEIQILKAQLIRNCNPDGDKEKFQKGEINSY